MGNSHSAKSPSGGTVVWRAPTQPALQDDLMDRNGCVAPWRRVKANRGAPWVDGLTVADFLAFAREHWPAIRQTLLNGTYSPRPVRRVEIPKPSGLGVRLLGTPAGWRGG